MRKVTIPLIDLTYDASLNEVIQDNYLGLGGKRWVARRKVDALLCLSATLGSVEVGFPLPSTVQEAFFRLMDW